MVRVKCYRLALFCIGISRIGFNIQISRLKMRQGPNFCFPTSASWTATTARAYYGRPAIDDKVTGPPKIQFQILLLRSETDMGLDFGALELANSATEGNENS
ncbi:uncharacterized protein TNCV_3592141 [Trichonephila clavipes]|nr:uncharacterized protein TNCV_3592141 [Trichonephila clavipes]